MGEYGKKASRMDQDILQDLKYTLIFRGHQGIHPHRRDRLAVACSWKEGCDQDKVKKRNASGNKHSYSVFALLLKSEIQADTDQE